MKRARWMSRLERKTRKLAEKRPDGLIDIAIEDSKRGYVEGDITLEQHEANLEYLTDPRRYGDELPEHRPA